MPVDDKYRRHLAERRAQLYGSTRLLTKDPHGVGMAGELINVEHWSEVLGRIIEQDLRNRPGGDGNAELELFLELDKGLPMFCRWFAEDVKATDKAYLENMLPVECCEIEPDSVYVRAFVTDVENAEGYLVGWEWGADLMKLPPRELRSGLNHVCEKMRPIPELDALVRNAKWSERWRRKRKTWWEKRGLRIVSQR